MVGGKALILFFLEKIDGEIIFFECMIVNKIQCSYRIFIKINVIFYTGN